MMKKAECEAAIRELCSQWQSEKGFPSENTADFHPSFTEFKGWAIGKGFGGYFDFRTVGGSLRQAETWFNQEFHQTWRD
jgi:hypothetical protein